MSTIGYENPTLMDVARRSDPDGKIATIVELLSETNDILKYMSVQECNNGTSHKTTVRTGLPSATWRLLNYGVQPSKSQTKQISDACGMLEAYAEVDKALADLNGNTAAFRLSEDRAFLEAMNQEMATTLFYGNTTLEPEKFNGFAPRYTAYQTSDDKLSTYNVIHGSGDDADNTSVWLIVWGPNTVHGLYPKGLPAGLSHRDLGEVTLEDTAGGRYQGYRTHYKWDLGLTVRDWRYAVRIANIEVSDLSGATAQKALINLMIQAEERIPNLGMGRAVWCMNRTVHTALRLGILEKIAYNLTWETVAGKSVMTFDGIPVARCDALVNDEDLVSPAA